MSAQLGELVVSMSVDMARFREDMGKANQVTQATMRQMQIDVSRSLGSVEGMVKTLGATAMGVTALLAGGAMFKGTIGAAKDVGGEIVKLSKSLGITAEQASVLRIGLDDAFLTADDMTGAASRMTKQLAKNEEAFNALGVSTRDGNSNFRNTVDIMADVNSKLSQFKEGTDRNIEGMKIYGKGWDEARKTLKLTAEAMEAAKIRAEELHLIFGDTALKQIREYKLAMKDIDDVAESLKVQIGMALIPELTRLAVTLGDTAVKGIPAFISGLHDVEAIVRISGASIDRFGASLANMMSLTVGGKFTQGGRWWQSIGQDLEKRAQAQEKTLQTLAYAEMGLDANGNRPKSAALKNDLRSMGGSADDAAAKAAEALRKENEYVKLYNKLQTERLKLQIQENINLTATGKKVEEVKLQYKDSIDLYPNHRAELERNLGLDIKNIETLGNESDALKVKNAETKESIKLMEEMTKDWSLQGLGSGLQSTMLAAAKPRKPKFDLLGAQESTGYGGNPTASLKSEAEESARIYRQMMEDIARTKKKMDTIGGRNYGSALFDAMESYRAETAFLKSQYEQRLIDKQTFDTKMIHAEEQYAAEKNALGFTMAEDSVQIMRQGFEGNKAMMLVALAMEKAIAVARIMMNTEVAASAAMAAAAAIPVAGAAIGAANAAAIRGMSYVSIGMVLASGAIEGMKIAGGRANGGPVKAGQTYLVNENRSTQGPEYFTPTMDGVVTPANKIGGGSLTQNITIDARGADSSVVTRIDAAMKRAKEEAKAEILSDMNRGGRFAIASGRSR